VLLTDRRAAASDTLATSYILSCAARFLGPFDVVFCGRQAIDGDTAQVGPQTAEKLGLTQITYVQRIEDVAGAQIVCRRITDEGYEIVAAKLPVLLTVTDTANEVRSPCAKRMMAFKKARAPVEIEAELKSAAGEGAPPPEAALLESRREKLASRGLLIRQINLADIGADLSMCGRDGSPTKVKRIQSIILTASGSKKFDPTPEGVQTLIHELVEDYAIG
jgi:electron transfer flavoprotein beta subunit